ncbi:jg2280 [Pararge aegeria aegeria]|uniref:Jg2280 protein n=1 Tax=Pararge aegeria aegeria TaxID=348720 RepID=A0A8S4RQA7_9NEOP|nr:jg2280 [Pararge aegeria aegeria]
MPSCIVKTCRNNSMVCKKESGVTFHKFPKDNLWQRKWIHIIRACRSEENWSPSQFSVVCSAHFAEGDTYMTHGGNRRITKNAIPTLKLNDVVAKKKKSDNSPTPVKSANVSVQTTNPGESVDDEIQRFFIIKVESTETTETGDVHIKNEMETQTADVPPNVTVKVEPVEPTEEQSTDCLIDPLAPEESDQADTNSENFAKEADLSYYELKLERKVELLHVCRRRIKILRQKVKRLQERNLKMKNILKEIRYKKLIDRKMFKKLTTTLIKNDD